MQSKTCLTYRKEVTNIATGSVQVEHCVHHNLELSFGHLKISQDVKVELHLNYSKE